MNQTNKENETVFRLKIVLEGTYPSVYRTIDIQKDATFYDLHKTIQIAFSWYDAHLHEFRTGTVVIGDPTNDEFGDMGIRDEHTIKLEDIFLKPKDSLRYIYDFGDDWIHTVTLEKIVPKEEKYHYPRCVRGKRCAPPEDIGGVWGFEEFKEAMSDHSHEAHEEWREWYDHDFDPDAFSLKEVNKQLQDM